VCRKTPEWIPTKIGRTVIASSGPTQKTVQRHRIEDAKRRLERTDEPVDEISWRVGYEDPAFFRRLFKRVTGMTPGAYRRRFQVPSFAQSNLSRSSA
jgi:AraC-like DNA-binding protein